MEIASLLSSVSDNLLSSDSSRFFTHLSLSNTPQISLGFKHFLLFDAIATYLNSYPSAKQIL